MRWTMLRKHIQDYAGLVGNPGTTHGHVQTDQKDTKDKAAVELVDHINDMVQC